MSSPTPSPTSAGYEEEYYIRYLHRFYHYGGANEFNLDDEDYWTAIYMLGGLVIILAVVLILAYFIFLCSRSACEGCRKDAGCGPSASRFILFLMTVCSTLLMLCSFRGYTDFIAGVDGVAEKAGTVKDVFGDLEGFADTIADDADDIQGYTNSDDAAWCESRLNSLGQDLDTHITSFQAVVGGGIKDELKYAERMFSDYIPQYVEYGIGFACCIVLLSSIFDILGNITKSSTMLNLASLLGTLSLLLLTLLVAFELSLSVFFADFCFYGPDEATVKVAQQLQADADDGDPIPSGVVAYYATCDVANPPPYTVNPLETFMNRTGNVLSDILATTTNSSCTSSFSDLTKVQQAAVDANVTYGSILDSMTCETMYNSIADMLETNICVDTVKGLWELWGVHTATSMVVYIALMFRSYVKQKAKVLKLMDEEGTVKAIPLGPPLAPIN